MEEAYRMGQYRRHYEVRKVLVADQKQENVGTKHRLKSFHLLICIKSK
jgi:hypothetical protein